MSIIHGTTSIPGITRHVVPAVIEVANKRTHYFGVTGVSEVRSGAGAGRPIRVQHILADASYTTFALLAAALNALDLLTNTHGNLVIVQPAISRSFPGCTFVGYRETAPAIPDVTGGITGTVNNWFVEIELDYYQVRT